MVKRYYWFHDDEFRQLSRSELRTFPSMHAGFLASESEMSEDEADHGYDVKKIKKGIYQFIDDNVEKEYLYRDDIVSSDTLNRLRKKDAQTVKSKKIYG